MVVERGRKKDKASEITDIKIFYYGGFHAENSKTCLEHFDLMSPICKIQTLTEESSENH